MPKGRGIPPHLMTISFRRLFRPPNPPPLRPLTAAEEAALTRWASGLLRRHGVTPLHADRPQGSAVRVNRATRRGMVRLVVNPRAPAAEARYYLYEEDAAGHLSWLGSHTAYTAAAAWLA